MKRVAAFLTAASLAVPLALFAQDVFKDVEYTQGRTGLGDKMKGKLIISPTKLDFVKDDSTVFTVPMETVKDVSNSLQTDPGGVGRKILLGVFASKREEFLYVNTETTDRAEAIVFKCHKKNTSAEMMAKIKFYMSKLKGMQVDTQRTVKPDSQKP